MKDRKHDGAMADIYREDLAYALQLLNSILEDGDQGELLIALRQMAKAFGGVQAIAEQAPLNPTQLYRTLSPEGNPALSSFSAILRAMGLKTFCAAYTAYLIHIPKPELRNEQSLYIDNPHHKSHHQHSVAYWPNRL